MGMVAMLVMWPRPFEQFSSPRGPGGCIWNLVAIGPVVSEEKWFEIVDGRRTTEPAFTISSPRAFGSGELKRMQAFEMRCYQRLLNISCKDHVTNEHICRKIKAAIGIYDTLLTLIKKWKLRLFSHILRSSGLTKTILQGTVKEKRRGRQKDVGRQYKGVDRDELH